MKGTTWIAIGCMLGGIAVILGAFGAHGLKQRVASGQMTVEQMEWFETGARYQFYHVFGILALGMLALRAGGSLVDAAGWAFVIGIVLFSGSLYVMTFTGMKKLGMITPIGGLAFIFGWFLMAYAAWKNAG